MSLEAIIQNCDSSYSDFLTDFKYYLEMKQLRQKTIEGYLLTTRRFIKLYGYNLTEENIFEFLNKTNTQSNYMTHLKGLAEFFYKKKELIDLKTYTIIKEMSYKNKRIKRTRYIEEDNISIDEKYKFAVPFDQWNNCYNQLEYKPQRMALWLGFNFGLRAGEISNLQWKNINFQANIIKIRETEGDEWNENGFKPKTINSERELKLTPTQRRVLIEYKQETEQLHLKHDYVIYQTWKRSQFKPVTKVTFGRWCNKVIVTINMEGYNIEVKLRPHCLRYSFSVRVYEMTGVAGLLTLSKMLGHGENGDIRTTQKYLAISDEELYSNMLDISLQSGF